MKVYELIELLEDYDPDMTVKAAIQPHYPLSAPIVGVNEDKNEVFILTGEANDYTSRSL